ncbi:hypothetical protein C4D60_Mb08t26420 [Musa balbisiana]|uniref:Uncharacterized protein n=1 Tax=Musa balbisiana TaxID=52838 RepID=A0A4S8K6N4_MUSBA|nr:hypothetical protein C4D60_Mb08t26420 [Musa balbisiana]
MGEMEVENGVGLVAENTQVVEGSPVEVAVEIVYSRLVVMEIVRSRRVAMEIVGSRLAAAVAMAIGHSKVSVVEKEEAVEEMAEEVAEVAEKAEEVTAVVEKAEEVTAVAEKAEEVTAVAEKAEEVTAVVEKAEEVTAVAEKVEEVAEKAAGGVPVRRACSQKWSSRRDDETGRTDIGDWGVAEVFRDVEGEAVVVDENGVKIPVEELWWHRALELVEAEVEVAEGREAEDDVREGAGEAIVADIELVEEGEAAEGAGEGAAEAIGVDVEEGEVGKEAELVGKVASEVAVVEINAGDDSEVGVGREGGAKDAGVVADAGADPVAGEVQGIGDDGELPGLEGNVGVTEVGVGES